MLHVKANERLGDTGKMFSTGTRSLRARRLNLLGFVTAVPLSKQISFGEHVNTNGFSPEFT